MEPLSNYSTREYNFTIWFFRLLASFAATILVLVLVLRINETVTIQEGEIVAANPQSDYKAPFEAQVVKIYVREGKPVQAGDTLLLLRNADLAAQQAKTLTEIQYLQKKIESFDVLEGAVERKKVAVDQASAITARKYQLEINRLVTDMKNLDEQYNLQQQRLRSAHEKYVGDSILYQKDMLSKYEYNNTRDANLLLAENMKSVASQRNKQASEKKLAYNDFTKEQNTLMLSKVQLEENQQALMQTKNDYESQLLQAKEALNKIETELKKQSLIATSDGIVNFLFNTKHSSNLINKGELLVSVAPKAITYYAKVIVPENEMPYVKSGLDVRLKMDAYQRFQKGPIRGKVSYVAERKENKKFYALVDLSETREFQFKPGYTLHGEIVIARLPLYRYFIKKLFRQFEQT